MGLGPALLGLLVAIKGKAMASAAANAVSAVAGFFKGASLASIASAGFATPVAIGAAIAASAALFKAMSSASQVNDFHSGPGGITHMTGPAGTFELNPRDSVLATTNPIPVNDFQTGPAGSMGGASELLQAQRETTKAITQLVLTAGRGEIKVAMEPQMGGEL